MKFYNTTLCRLYKGQHLEMGKCRIVHSISNLTHVTAMFRLEVIKIVKYQFWK